MKKINNVPEIMTIWKKWFVLLIWAVIILFVVQSVGIVVHEFGHYSTGRLFGCDNLTVSVAKLSIQDSISNVSGWEYCSEPLVMAKDGSRVCNFKTNIISFAGLGFSLLILIPIIILLNLLIKRKIKKYYLSGSYLVIILLFTIVMEIKSASFDLFKIGECLFNTQTGDIIFRVISLLPTFMIIPIIILFFFDLIKIMNALNFKQISKKEVS
ncbi:MAG: hypothetical protein M1416_02850 [Candidatus Pacearchaeota archaeon]|nr:hypothetical protein [Candidatus Pacearchaeota archaeon]